MDKKNLLFDLDGTIIAPEEGILNSLVYAYEKMGLPTPPHEELLEFIGPPLIESFTERYGWSVEKANEGIAYYRERFAQKGLYENHLYTGIASLLEELQQKGFRLFLATSKPTVYAKQILEHYKLNPLFEDIVGSNLDNTRGKKTEIIQYVIDEHGLSADNSLMVGDRSYDIVGAKNNGLYAIGVSYGHGSIVELKEAGADWIVDSCKELRGKILKDW